MRNIVKNVIQRTGHIKTRRDAGHRQHFGTEGRPPHGAQMHVAVDDSRLQNQSREIKSFACLCGQIRADFGYFSVFNGNVPDIVDAVHRINHVRVFYQQIVHIAASQKKISLTR